MKMSRALEQRIDSAHKARQRWLDACASGRPHGEVLSFWESYVALARLAGIQP